jgi:MFS family permease
MSSLVHSVKRSFSLFYDEIGLATLINAPNDVYLIIILRMVRLIGFGGTSLILALYLREINFNELYIGLFMTLTFVGDLLTSFLLSLVADNLGRKNVLILSSAVMAFTGFAFGYFENQYVLTAIAVFGVLTPSGGEVGPFRSVEQSAIASLMLPAERSDIYAWYTFLGLFCAALGSVVCGTFIDYAQEILGYSLVESYKFAFVGYGVLSLPTLVMSLFISKKIEWDLTNGAQSQSVAPRESENEVSEVEGSETTPLIPSLPATKLTKKSQFNFLPTLHPSTYSIVIKLSLLFALDAFASSLVPFSWQTYYIKKKFDISASYLGSVFFVVGIVSGFMSLLSTSLTKRIGPVVTMVVTHLPASLLLTLVPFPNSMKFTMEILVLRASMQSMDVTPKHVFLAALIPDSDRTAVFGWVNVVKTLASTIGPMIVGVITKHGYQWVTFVVAGLLKATYDVGILVTFLTFNRHGQH